MRAPVPGTIACLVVGILTSAGHAQQPAIPAAPTRTALVLDNVTVVDVERGRLVPDQRVVIAGNQLEIVGHRGTIKLPQRAQVVDARGRYLIPGLWDMHIHPGRAVDIFYPLLLANGVTGIRDAGSPVPLDTQRLWRQEILAGTRIGPPRQILSGQSLDDGNCPLPREPKDVTTCVADPADARHVVDSLAAAGADMIKLHALSSAGYFAVAAEARRLGVPFGGHVEQVTATEAADSGARIVDHLRFPNPLYPHTLPFVAGLADLTDYCLISETASIDPCQALAAQFRRQDTWAVMDQVVYPLARYPGHQEFWAGGPLPAAWLRDTIPVYGDSGGAMRLMERVAFPILAGTDFEDWIVLLKGPIPGFMLQANLAAYVAAGLSPLNALRSATLDPARALHATDSLGTVAARKLADLVLLDADPLADIANLTAIRAVVANGRYFDRAALDQLLVIGRAAAQANRAKAKAP